MSDEEHIESIVKELTFSEKLSFWINEQPPERASAVRGNLLISILRIQAAKDIQQEKCIYPLVK